MHNYFVMFYGFAYKVFYDKIWWFDFELLVWDATVKMKLHKNKKCQSYKPKRLDPFSLKIYASQS